MQEKTFQFKMYQFPQKYEVPDSIIDNNQEIFLQQQI